VLVLDFRTNHERRKPRASPLDLFEQPATGFFSSEAKTADWTCGRVRMKQPFDFEAFIQAAGDAIVAAGPDGAVLLWNRAAERIFGYTEQEAVGQSLDLIIPERLRNRHWEGYRKVMQTGETRYGTDVLRVPAAHKDGRRLSIAFTVALLYSPEHKVRVIVAIIRDETSRWEEERALRQRLAALEAKLQKLD
jgi:PAS domain S-box-containing protein